MKDKKPAQVQTEHQDEEDSWFVQYFWNFCLHLFTHDICIVSISTY